MSSTVYRTLSIHVDTLRMSIYRLFLTSLKCSRALLFRQTFWVLDDFGGRIIIARILLITIVVAKEG